MATKKNWNKEFLEYMELIVSDPAYKGIPYDRNKEGKISWIAAKKSVIGKKRIDWALDKAKHLGYQEAPGIYAKVMLELHPFKEKPCQVCGKIMSLKYVYLNTSLCNSLNKYFSVNLTTLDSLSSAYKVLLNNGFEKDVILSYIAKELKIKYQSDETPEDFFSRCESFCRNGGSKKLGPGAMSNFPDRLDGFHSYNRCCRTIEDKGRHKDNMRTYEKDRRAYENWSDGNIHAANKFMTSLYFKGTSADHIGPISLGFKHDSLLLRKMNGSENSTKRDHLLQKDIEELIKIEKNNPSFSAMSWFSESIWLYIKKSYNKYDNLTPLRDALKQNLVNYLAILGMIINQCGEKGREFLINTQLESKFKDFEYDYEFNEIGEITSRKKRNITDSTKKEIARFSRIAFDSITEYHIKENRNLKESFTPSENEVIELMLTKINESEFGQAKDFLKKIVCDIEDRAISGLAQQLDSRKG